MKNSDKKIHGIFDFAAQTVEPRQANPIFSEFEEPKEENIIPPVGIAKPELVNEFIKNIGKESAIKKAIQDEEEYARENPQETAKRQIYSHTARFMEGLGGSIGSLFNFMFAPVFDPEEWEEREGGPPLSKLPETEELREKTREKTGKYLEPRTELDRATQETVEDFGSLLSMPFGKIWTKLLQASGAQLTKQTIKSTGGSEWAQDAGKLGFLMMTDIARLGNSKNVAMNSLSQAKELIPQGLRIATKDTEHALNTLKNQPWYKTGTTPTKSAAFKEIDRIEKSIKNGTMDLHEAMQLRHDINEIRRDLGAFKLPIAGAPQVDTERAINYINKVDDALLSSMKNYGEKANTKWWKQYGLANEAIKVTNRSNSIANYIEKSKVGKALKSDTAKILFHAGGVKALSTLPYYVSIGVPAAAGGIQAVKIINRMINSPILRKHYLEVLSAASANNLPVLEKAIKNLDNAALKYESPIDHPEVRENQPKS